MFECVDVAIYERNVVISNRHDLLDKAESYILVPGYLVSSNLEANFMYPTSWLLLEVVLTLQRVENQSIS